MGHTGRIKEKQRKNETAQSPRSRIEPDVVPADVTTPRWDGRCSACEVPAVGPPLTSLPMPTSVPSGNIPLSPPRLGRFDEAPTSRHVRDLKRKERLNKRNDGGKDHTFHSCQTCLAALLDWDHHSPVRCEIGRCKPVDLTAMTLSLYEKEKTKGNVNAYDCLPENDDSCQYATRLLGLARVAVNFLRTERGLKASRPLPTRIECGQLRSTIRGLFDSIPLEDELSIKTSAKLETGCCEVCEPRFTDQIKAWKEARQRPVMPADEDHLRRFEFAMRQNVPRGWDAKRVPFIPNGHATKGYGRKQGGNWNEEEFSDDCRVKLVFSSGKPRVVTLYSSYNTQTLMPLHSALYAHLSRKGWLLKGPPTAARVLSLDEAGEYVSVDYSSATDNIRLDYVRVALGVLKDQACGLSEEEERCLDVLGRLRLDGAPCYTGQPMGSVMSFPLLCLMNKTLVDLALTDLLVTKKIGFKEWTRHRCLINGDDLLLREPRKGKTLLMDRLSENARKAGMVVNAEKSMIDSAKAEINSTLFIEGQEKKKTNCGALAMKSTVNDVLGFAKEASTTLAGFKYLVRSHANVLARQADKKFVKLPEAYRRVCLSDRKIKRSLLSLPSTAPPKPPNLMPIVSKPEGYNLSNDREAEAIRARVAEIRQKKLWVGALTEARKQKRFRSGVTRGALTLPELWKQKPVLGEEVVLLCCAQLWEKERKAALIEEEGSAADILYPETSLVYDGNRIGALVDLISKEKLQSDPHRSRNSRRGRQEHDTGQDPPGLTKGSEAFVEGDDWIAL